MSEYYVGDELSIDLFGVRPYTGSLSSALQIDTDSICYYYGKIKSSITFKKLKIIIEFATEDLPNAEACRTSDHLAFMEGWQLLVNNISAKMLEEHLEATFKRGQESARKGIQKEFRNLLGMTTVYLTDGD